jgi:hypothetical protein
MYETDLKFPNIYTYITPFTIWLLKDDDVYL